MKDILLPIGSIIGLKTTDKIEQYMIIGHRVINHETMNSWDYISVPFIEGFKRKIIFKSEKSEINEKNIILKSHKMEREENFFYFNHYEIDKIIYENNFILDKNLNHKGELK